MLEVYTAPRPWEPKPYMSAVLEWLNQKTRAAVLLDPGMGKTSILLAWLLGAQADYGQQLKDEGLGAEQRQRNRLRAVVVGPRRVIRRVWRLEAKKWTQFNHFEVAIVHGSPKIRERAMCQDADIYCVTHEGFKWLADSGWIDKAGIKVLVIDELSKYKRGNTARHKHIRKFLPKFSCIIGLTGSFMPRSLLDVWGQMYCIDQGRALGKWFTHYRSEFFDAGGYMNYQFTPKQGARETILGRLKETCISLSAEEHIDLPELVIDDREFDLPEDVRVKYRELEKEYLTFVDEDRITAANAAVAKAKCRQLCSGGLYAGDDEAVLLHEEKL